MKASLVDLWGERQLSFHPVIPSASSGLPTSYHEKQPLILDQNHTQINLPIFFIIQFFHSISNRKQTRTVLGKQTRIWYPAGDWSQSRGGTLKGFNLKLWIQTMREAGREEMTENQAKPTWRPHIPSWEMCHWVTTLLQKILTQTEMPSLIRRWNLMRPPLKRHYETQGLD